jgi:hypothetical protein
MPANCPGANEPSTTGQARDKAQPSPAKQKTMSLPKSTSGPEKIGRATMMLYAPMQRLLFAQQQVRAYLIVIRGIRSKNSS